ADVATRTRTIRPRGALPPDGSRTDACAVRSGRRFLSVADRGPATAGGDGQYPNRQVADAKPRVLTASFGHPGAACRPLLFRDPERGGGVHSAGGAGAVRHL